MIINKPHSYEKFTATDGQVDFKLSQRYAPNTESIFVYLNGMAQAPGVDFTETNENTISIKNPCEQGDVVIISHLKELTPGIRIGTGDIVGSKATSLFKKYSGEKRLKSNQKYTISLHILNKDHTFTFTSAYTPFYSTNKIIRTDLLNVISDITDEVIDFHIWQNSKDVADIATVDYLDKLGNPTKATKQWVRYKTEIDIVNAVYMNIATNAGSVSKKLGEMSVTKSVKIPYLSDLLLELKKKLNQQESLLTGIYSMGVAVVKAGKTSYPVTQRRSF